MMIASPGTILAHLYREGFFADLSWLFVVAGAAYMVLGERTVIAPSVVVAGAE